MKFVRCLIIKVFPTIVYDRETSLKAIKNLNEKLRDTRTECGEWRKRALETEWFLRKHKSMTQELASEFDAKGKTNIKMQLW